MTKKLGLRRGLRQQLESSIPNIEDIVLYINSTCNLRCKHCYIGNSLLSENNIFNADDVCHFIEEFDSLSRITILGGEPLMHKGINEILRATLACRILERRVTTNLTSFFFLKRLEFRSAALTFAVSLDGHDSISHDFVRSDGSFKNTLRNVKTIINDGFDVEISHTITARNIGYFQQLVSLCKTNVIKKLNIHKMSLQGNAIDNAELYVQPKEWVEFCQRLLKLSRSNYIASDILRVRFPVIYAKKKEFEKMVEAGEYWGHRHRSYYAANQGRRVVLYPNGRVYVSSELFGTDSHIGTIQEGKFVTNESFQSEINANYADDDPLLLSKLGAATQSDKNYPAILSVSFKRTVYI
jgi:MoaA/NifB/PqqE/SkfB family radical SAM enzyme